MLNDTTRQLTGGSSLRWIETIKVQSANGKGNATKKELIFLAREIQENTDPQKLGAATVSSHTSVPGCFALRLFWNTNEPRIRGTALGMSLARSLKIFGLVDHSVWIETSETEGDHVHEHGIKKGTTSFES